MPLIFRSKPWKKTQERLNQAGLTNAQLILQGHETLDQFVTEVKAGIFNLGYLPSADKSVITQPQTTIEALEKLVSFAGQRGDGFAIMIYYGHEGGDIERDAVLNFVSQVEPTRVHSCHLPNFKPSQQPTIFSND